MKTKILLHMLLLAGCNSNPSTVSLAAGAPTSANAANTQLQTGLATALTTYTQDLVNSISPYNCLPDGTCPGLSQIQLPLFAPTIAGLNNSSQQNTGVFTNNFLGDQQVYSGTYGGFSSDLDYILQYRLSTSVQPLSESWSAWLKTTQLAIPTTINVAVPSLSVSLYGTIGIDNSGYTASPVLSLTDGMTSFSTANYEMAVIGQLIVQSDNLASLYNAISPLLSEANRYGIGQINNQLPFVDNCFSYAIPNTLDPFNGLLGQAVYDSSNNQWSYGNGNLVLSTTQSCSHSETISLNFVVNYVLKDQINNTILIDFSAPANWNWLAPEGCGLDQAYPCPSGSPSQPGSEVPNLPINPTVTQPTVN